MRASLTMVLLLVIVLSAIAAPAKLGQEARSRFDCPASMPNGQVPAGWDPSSYYSDEANVSVDQFYGNGATFVRPPEDGTLSALRDERTGGGWNKLILFRWPVGADLVATILPFGWEHRGEPARMDPSPGQEQFAYQVFAVWFPSEGCWEIGAHSSGTVLRIVLNVVFVDGWNPPPVAPIRVGPLA